MIPFPVNLDESALNQSCLQGALPWRVKVLAETASTNDWLRDFGRTQDANGLVVFTEKQTAGRGRRDHVWQAAAGQDLLFSAGWRTRLPMPQWTRITPMVGLAVCQMIEAELGLSVALKWPNDVMIGGRKVCGILVEAFGSGDSAYLVIGVGVNVNGVKFQDELAASATSLRLACDSITATERGLNRQDLATVLLVKLAECLTACEDETAFLEAINEVRSRQFLMGKQIQFTQQGTLYWGRMTGLDDEGAMLVETANGAVTAIHSADQVRELK